MGENIEKRTSHLEAFRFWFISATDPLNAHYPSYRALSVGIDEEEFLKVIESLEVKKN